MTIVWFYVILNLISVYVSQVNPSIANLASFGSGLFNCSLECIIPSISLHQLTLEKHELQCLKYKGSLGIIRRSPGENFTSIWQYLMSLMTMMKSLPAYGEAVWWGGRGMQQESSRVCENNGAEYQCSGGATEPDPPRTTLHNYFYYYHRGSSYNLLTPPSSSQNSLTVPLATFPYLKPQFLNFLLGL